LSCGEASGERYGARLVTALRELDPSLRFSALGGQGLAEVGVTLVESSRGITIMGFAEVLGAMRRILYVRRAVWRHLAQGDIDLCVPIDFPGFNLRLASRAKALGIPVFYLIPPQLWAWGRWRLPGLRRSVDRIGTILPFEAEFYRRYEFPVVPLGHPLMEDYGPFPFDRLVEEREGRLADRNAPLTIGLLPGSRGQEIQRLLPIMKAAAHIITSWLSRRQASFVVSAAPGIEMDRLMGLLASGLQVSDEPLPQLLRRLDMAIVCSGTASLEAALAGVPHEIVYVTSPLNFWLARRLVRVPHVGLANLILGRELAREHIQGQATPLSVSRALMNWLSLPQARHAFYQDARWLRELCGEPGVWRRTAAAILDFLATRRG
jgi:lipid-A-disaccharide synthase